MVHADVDPGDEVLLREALAVEELIEVHERRAREVHVVHATRRGLCILATRDGKVVPRPVRVLQQALRANDRLVTSR